jgi:cyclomaltodextrinase
MAMKRFPVSALLLATYVAAAASLCSPLPGNDPLHGRNIAVEKVGPHLYEVAFAHPGGPTVKSVEVAGSFNQWNPKNTPMKLDPATGAWSGLATMEGGEYQYKFVLNGAEWGPDPANPLKDADGFGGQNSVLRLGPMARVSESRAKVGDSRLQDDALIHVETLPLFFRPLPDGKALVRFVTLANDAEKAEIMRPSSSNVVDLAAAPADSLSWGSYPMTKASSDSRFDYWEATIVLDAGNTLVYAFVATDGSAKTIVDAKGTRPGPGKPLAPFARRFVPSEVFDAPGWAKETIWYEIMPDRWRNGNPKNDPPNTSPWTSAWKEPAPWEGKDGQTFYNYYVYGRRFGGDFKGIEEKLPHLQKLGVSGIYLTPVFMAQSYHGYDIVDYRHVDDRFAVPGASVEAALKEDLLDASTWTWSESDQAFLELLKSCRARGVRVIVDLPLNHSGDQHPAFKNAKENGRDSAYRNWYNVASWDPFQYEGWGGFGMMPVFQEDSYGFTDSRLRQHFFDITRRWLDPNGDGDPSDGVDGFRLDAAKEVSSSFWREWRQFAKGINPRCLIVGEIWERPDAYLGGDMFDCVMNYQMAIHATRFFIDKKKPSKPSEFEASLSRQRLALPEQANQAMLNLIDSHDTDRALSMFHNPDRPYDRRNQLQGDGPTYDVSKPGPESVARLKFFLAFQMTYLGSPMIYYGDEVGMFGADDPNNRQPMWWDDLGAWADKDIKIDADLLEHYSRLAAIRNTWECFRSGGCRSLVADDRNDVFGYARQGKAEAAIVLFNRSDAERVVTLNVKELRDAHGPVQQWADVLRTRDYRLVNLTRPGESVTRRGIRATPAIAPKTRVDGTIEVKLAPREAAILVSGSGQ